MSIGIKEKTMTNIQKMIEEEYSIEDFERLAMETDYAVFANEDACKINEADAGAFYKEGYIHGYKSCLSQLQHANRWRKMSEELPEENTYFLIRNSNASYSYVARYYKERKRFVDTRGFSIYYSNYLEWKPIE